MQAAAVAAVAATLVLAGCGRKGPLDPPPAAAAAPQATVQQDDRPRVDATQLDPDETPALGPGARRRFPLDVLID